MGFCIAGDFNRLPYNLVGVATNSGFSDFVDYHEEENLRKLFGNLFFNALLTGIDGKPDLFVEGVVKAVNDLVVYLVDDVADVYKCIQATDGSQLPTDAAYWEKQSADRWVRVKFGDSFIVNKSIYKWFGMRRLCIPLIYSLWTRFTFDSQTENGIVEQANENSIGISPNERIIRGWNDYARVAGGYGHNGMGYNYSNCTDNDLYSYLRAKSTDFDDLIEDTDFSSFNEYLNWSFKYPGRQNFLDL